MLSGGAGADLLDGGSGRDAASYLVQGASEGVSASLLRGRGWAGDAAGDRIAGVEDLRGGNGGDTLTGDHGYNKLYGGHGDDTLMGNGGDDLVYGGVGRDVAVLGYDRDDYVVTRDGIRTTVEYVGPGPGSGTDLLGHVEVLRFADGDLVL